MTFERALSPEKELMLIAEYEDGWTVNELTIIYRVSTRTVYRILARNKVPRVSKRLRRPRKNPRPRPPRELKPCGTNAAYARHNRKGEYPCTACLEAHAADVMKHKNKRKRKR